MTRTRETSPVPEQPPRPLNEKGARRRVGVEIEFANMTTRRAAEILCDMFGGDLETHGPHEFALVGSELGDFGVELDTFLAQKGGAGKEDSFEDGIVEMIGNVAATVVPCEIVAPPLPVEDLPKLDGVVQRLSEEGASGTARNPLYGFGLHLNPETPSFDGAYLLAILRAYLLLSEWLRAQIAVDATRKVLGYAGVFPGEYADLVLEKGYRPDRSQLIDDYLRFNPTRNRELDMLPLFAFIDADRVAGHVNDKRVGARPAFHYRLPNAQLNDPDWGIVAEWNRWVTVERLAEDDRRLRRMAEAYRTNRRRFAMRDWVRETQRWLKA